MDRQRLHHIKPGIQLIEGKRMKEGGEGGGKRGRSEGEGRWEKRGRGGRRKSS